MPKRIGHFVWHFSRHSLKLMGLFAILSCAVIAAFIWRVSSAPLDITFAKDYIQSALRDNETGSYADMKQAVLYWPDFYGPLYLQLHDAQLFNQNGDTIFSVNSAAISFSRSRLLIGKIMPKAIVLKQPSLQLLRTEDGDISVNLGKQLSENKSKSQFEVTTRIFGYIARPGQESANDSIISRLEAFRIEDARLVINDEVAKQSWSLPDFNLNLQSTERGMEANIDVSMPDIGLQESKIHIGMDYVWDEKNVSLTADVSNLDVKSIIEKIPELSEFSNQNIVADAHIETLLNERFIPSDIRVAVTSEDGSFSHPEMSDAPLEYKDMSFKATYNYNGKALNVTDTHITLKGITINADAAISHTDTQVNGPVKLWVDTLQQSDIDPVWPKALRGDSSELWVVKRMSEGTFKNLWVNFDLSATKGNDGWDTDAAGLVAGFDFENMSVDYEAPLDKGKNLYGKGAFDLDKDELTIHIDKGNLGVMPVKKGTLYFDKIVAVGEGNADIKVNVDAEIADVLRYISKEPINLGEKIGMDIAQVKGTSNLNLHINFPAQPDVKIKDFQINVDGILKNVNFPDVLSDLDLSGGPLNFSIKDGLAEIKGKALLDKREMDFTWNTYLESEGKPFKEKVQAKITADPNIRQKLGIDLSEFIEGSLPVDVTYVLQRNGTAKANVKVDATPALFFVEPFDFAKEPGKKAEASFVANLKSGVLQNIEKLTAKGDLFKLGESTVSFQQKNNKTELLKGKFPQFTLDKTLGNLEFIFDESGTANIVLNADVLDAQPFMAAGDKSKEYNEPPMKISVSAKTMLTSPDDSIKNVSLFYDIDDQGRFNRMEIDASVGNGNLFVRFKPDEDGKRTFRMKTDDAGSMLKAFQVYNNIQGGEMVIYGEPIRGVLDRNLSGKAEITNFKVIEAPALTKILSILSLTGIGEALSSNGLAFDKLEAEFSWLYRKGGSLLVLKEGRTSGNSLGLLFDGTFDNQKREVDVSGTVVPMSTLNEIIGSIPLVGDILTGGSGGVFAATYSITGSSDAPEISVNPLSVITPGIIRRVLFE